MENPRGDLRMVEVTTNNVTKETIFGFFHLLIKSTIDGNESVEGLVELENGNMKKFYYHQIRFLSEGETNSYYFEKVMKN